MGRKYYGILALLAMIGLIVAVSGCTNSTATNPKEDIYMDSLTIIPGYTNGNGETGWGVNFKLLSKTQTPYKDVNVSIVTTDSNNQVTNNWTWYVNYLPKEGEDITFFRKNEIAHVNITIINATQSK